MTNMHFLILILNLRKFSQCCYTIPLFWRFSSCFPIWISVNFEAKNLCDIILKIENMRWQFRSIFHWLHGGVLHFVCQCCFQGEICKTKWPLFNFLGKPKKSCNWVANFSTQEASPNFSMISSSWTFREVHFGTPNFHQGYQESVLNFPLSPMQFNLIQHTLNLIEHIVT